MRPPNHDWRFAEIPNCNCKLPATQTLKPCKLKAAPNSEIDSRSMDWLVFNGQRNNRAGSSIADLKSHYIFRAADPPHDANKRLVRAQLTGYGCSAVIAVTQDVRSGRVCVRCAAIDRNIVSRLLEQLTNIVRDAFQLHCIGGRSRRYASTGIVKLEIKDRELDR